MLTEAEERAYQLLSKSQRRWRYGRFIVLLCGLAVVAVGVLLQIQWEKNLLDLTQRMTDKPISGAEVYFSSQAAVILAQSHLLMPLGCTLAGWAVGHWKGNPMTTLLLGVVERVRRQEKSPAV
jgi:hypothetical protein